MADWVEVTEGNFEELIVDSRKPVLVDFWAAWCGPCQVMATVISTLALQFGDQMAFAKCDIDCQPNLAQRFGIESVPALIIFNNGKPIEFITGVATPQQVAESIAKVIPASRSDGSELNNVKQ